MRKISAMAIMVVMMLPVLCVLPVNDARAENLKADVRSGEFVPVTLYFHNESNLDTKAPTANNSTTTSLKEGAITFETDSLDKDLSVENQSFRVAFNFTVNVTQGNPYVDYVRINLTISVREDGTERASAKYIGEKVYAGAPPSPVSESFSVDTTLCFAEGWDFEFDEDDEIRVRITPEIEEHDVSGPYGVDIQLIYTAYMEYDYEDRLGVLSNVYCAPVEIELGTYDKNNQPKTEFMPNLAAEECIIRFRGGIEDAFGYDDITYVSIEINGVTSSENITGNKRKELLYEWDYSSYSKSFVADTPYTATITVETVQHTFTQSTSFNFSAYGLDGKINDKASASETILAGSKADYTINIKNIGASEATVRVTLDISVSPSGSHEWNITLDSKFKETSTTANLSYSDFKLTGGHTKSLTLSVKSLDEEIGENWYCMVSVKIEFIGHPKIIETLSSYTYLAPPYKIDLTWTETYSDPYYALVDVSSTLYVKVTNMGTMPDTVNLSFSYTNYDMWDITLEPQVVNLSSFYQTGYYNSGIKITVKPSSGAGEGTAFVNITAYSKGFEQGYNKSLTCKYLTLNMSRAVGIKPLSVEAQGSESVDVKDSSGQVTYKVSLETNDNTTHTVDLIAICDYENITTNFPESVEVSKDSPQIVTLTVTCPKGTLAGDYTIAVTASIIQNDVSVPEHDRTVNVNVTVKPFYALSVKWADSNNDEITVIAKPGEYVNKDLTVVNNGNSEIPEVSIMSDSELFDNAVPGQFALFPGEEKTVTVSLYVPKDARNGDTFAVKVNASYGKVSDDATIIIKSEQGGLEILMNILSEMIYFIILLVAVVVVFIALWAKRRK